MLALIFVAMIGFSIIFVIEIIQVNSISEG
jgi:hypothetical protein